MTGEGTLAQSAPVAEGGASSRAAGPPSSEHLPIGEVLALLQEEFPDVTISKIRFLESQGLIQPERTASGYRRFSAADIERLQWILRQQRDHFLPLKVIRKMLDEGVDRYDPGGGIQPTLFTSSATEPESEDDELNGGVDDDAGPQSSSPRRSPAHPAVASAPSRQTQERPAPADRHAPAGRAAPADRSDVVGRPSPRPAERAPVDPAATSRGSAPAAPAAPGADRSGDASTQQSGRQERASSPTAGSHHGGDPSDPAPGDHAVTGDDADESGAPSPDDTATESERPPHSTPADVVAALQEDPRKPRRSRGSSAAKGGAREPSPSSGPDVRGGPSEPVPDDTRVGADELCRLGGIDATLLVDLERFGLVQADGRSGEYGPSAVEVVRLAARYRDLGVEPRHLRMYLVAAEREAGMVEQLAVPFLKQRNPNARGQAAVLTGELVALGADLHRSLLRRELGRDLMP